MAIGGVGLVFAHGIARQFWAKASDAPDLFVLCADGLTLFFTVIGFVVMIFSACVSPTMSAPAKSIFFGSMSLAGLGVLAIFAVKIWRLVRGIERHCVE